MRYTHLLFIIITIFLFSCESMEDTYSEYSDLPRSRATGKCYNLSAQAGWKRIKLEWENSLDKTIEKIKVVWSTSESRDSALLEADATSFTTEANLGNKDYQFELTAISKEGVPSLPTIAYKRPYTPDNELLSSFAVIENKYFFINNNLVVYLNPYNENMVDVKLNYFSNGEEKFLELTESEFANMFVEVKDIDLDKPVRVLNTSKIEDCFDTIVFESYKLYPDMFLMNIDFSDQLRAIYNVEEITNEWRNSIETLYIDYSLESIEDIMYFPNLKKVVLGKHRYMNSRYITQNISRVTDLEQSLYALNKMKELNDISVISYNYNYYYLLQNVPYKTNDGQPTLPVINDYDIADWTVECSTDEEGYDTHPSRILYTEVDSVWKPLEVQDALREHELIIDMREEKEIGGFLFRQPENFAYKQQVFPATFEIYVSNDKTHWMDPMNFIPKQIGIGRGETTILEMPASMTVRYVKLVVDDGFYYGRKYTYIDVFKPFKNIVY